MLIAQLRTLDSHLLYRSLVNDYARIGDSNRTIGTVSTLRSDSLVCSMKFIIVSSAHTQHVKVQCIAVHSVHKFCHLSSHHKRCSEAYLKAGVFIRSAVLTLQSGTLLYI